MILHIGWQLSFQRSTSRLPFQHNNFAFKRTFVSRSAPSPRKFRRAPWIASAFLLSGVGLVSYDPPQQPIAHTFHAMRRCSRVAEAVVPSAVDYKRTLSQHYDSETSRQGAMSECHTRSAKRVLRAMLANGGEFRAFRLSVVLLTNTPKGYTSKWGKLWLLCSYLRLPPLVPGLNICRAMLPKEWTHVMRVLQDQCDPTPVEDLGRLFVTDMGQDIHEIFDDFDPNPIGVASLAQVHVGRYKKTGQLVAVKVSHVPFPRGSLSLCRISSCNTLISQNFLRSTWRRWRWPWVGESPHCAWAAAYTVHYRVGETLVS